MSKSHLEPATLANVVDITVYADGIKLTFGDSPDGTERSMEHRGSYFLSTKTASFLTNTLMKMYTVKNAPANKN